MKFKIGDKVKFLNEVGEGEVTAILDEKLVKVKIEDGFEIPVMANELVIARSFYDYSGENEKPESNDRPVEKKVTKREGPDLFRIKENVRENTIKNVFAAFVPENGLPGINADIDLYLVNDCDYAIYYFIGSMENVTWHYLGNGKLEDNSKIRIKTFNQSDLSKIKKLNIQILFLSKGKYVPQEPVNKTIDIENTRFYKESTYKENDFFTAEAFILSVTGESIISKLNEISEKEVKKALKTKEITEEKKNIPKFDPEIQEIDLHIHEIVDNEKDLTPGEILDIQMSRFKVALEGAILGKAKKIVFIHGVGNGKLKYEIGKTLSEKYPNLKYQDASFKEYGYGATLVLLQ